MSGYRDAMVARFWRYQKEAFRDRPEIFERPDMGDGRPPVFLRHAAESNVLMAPDISGEDRSRLLREIPPRERHRWFRSMSSSQAIALSVFGNLKMYGLLGLLNGLHDEQGRPIFGDEAITPENFRMEYKVDSLGEPRPTSLDALITGKHPVAIECKLTEPDVGSCSRPNLTNKRFQLREGSLRRNVHRPEGQNNTVLVDRDRGQVLEPRPACLQVDCGCGSGAVSLEGQLPACEEPAGCFRSERRDAFWSGTCRAGVRREEPGFSERREGICCIRGDAERSPRAG